MVSIKIESLNSGVPYITAVYKEEKLWFNRITEVNTFIRILKAHSIQYEITNNTSYRVEGEVNERHSKRIKSKRRRNRNTK